MFSFFILKNNNRRLGLEKFVYLVLIFFYILIPLLYVISFDDLKKNTYNFWVLKTELDIYSVSNALSIYFFATFFIVVGIFYGKKINFSYGNVTNIKLKVYYYFLILISVLSTLATFLYVYKIGGVIQAIVEANLYRAHGLKEPPIGQLSKLQPFIIYSSLLLLPFKKWWNYFFVFVAIFYLIIEASRTNVGLYFFAFYLYYLNANGKFKLYKLIVPLFFAVFLAVLGNSITDYIETGQWVVGSSAFYAIVSQFSPSISNVFNMYNFVDEFGLGFFYDVTSIFPQKLFGFDKTVKTWELLTEYYLGGFYTVGIPIDLFSYGYSQFSYLGVVLVSSLYGLFIGSSISFIKFIRFTSTSRLQYDLSIMLELVLCFFAMSLLAWGSMDSTVFYGNAKYWIPLLVFFLITKFKFQGRN